MTGEGGSGTDAAAFSALALSSPERWRTLRLVRTWRGQDRPEAVRAWVRRPDAIRVEQLDGTLVEARVREPGSSRSRWRLRFGGSAEAPDPGAGTAADSPTGGATAGDASTGDAWLPMHLRRPEVPFFQDYHWVAMLDPYELAVGADLVTGATPPPVDVDSVQVVDHHGRPALEALVRTLPGYDPRCDCCPLLFGAESEARSAEAGGPTAVRAEPGLLYPDAHLVRLDIGTGVCVRTEQVGGSRSGDGHDVRIEAVDEDVPDESFVGAAPSARSARRWSRRRS